jgi:uncharacterized RDD family membrane protein YckC
MDGLAPAGHAPATGSQFDNRRVLAALIDLLLLVPVAIVMSMLFGGWTDAAAALTAGWALYYYFALESDHGQTLGKRVMKIRVVRADGGPLDLGRVAVRTLLRPIDGLFLYLVGLVVMIATGQRRQRLGDLAAGTVVTSADAPEAPEPVPAVAEVPEAPVIEPPPLPPPPEPMMDADAAPDPLAGFDAPPTPEPAPEPEPEPTVDEIVPVDRPDEPGPPTDEPVPVDPPEKLEIISSPIDVIMDDDDEEPEAPQDQPQA